MSEPSIIILMGVSGSGKSTVGKALAVRLGWSFIEGDDYHPPENVEAMAAGRPLTDTDRQPWLLALRARIERALDEGQHAVVACSALRHAYRRVLAGGEGGDAVSFVHLEVPAAILRQRLSYRPGHYMPASLLETQLAILEQSHTAMHLDGARPVPEVVEAIVRGLGW